PYRFRKEDKLPVISISKLQTPQLYFDITNHGGDILNLRVQIKWLQESIAKEREMNNFFNENDNPSITHSHKCNSLRKGEVKKVDGCPMYSDNGEIKVIVSGEDIDGKRYEKELKLNNEIKAVRI
ncbi:MAG: hypothetical protein ACOZAJ_02940, partial [Patescibacteria group bacterium]